MNYLKTPLFLIFFGLYCYLIGSAFTKLFNIKKNTFEKKIVSGFFVIFLIGFFIGLPSQLFSISWNEFFIMFTITNVILLILSFRYVKSELFDDFYAIKEKPKEIILSHLKKRWFIYLLVVLFSILSILNTQPYLWCNYHDDYYIAKVVNLQGTPHLLNEIYEVGQRLTYNSRFDYLKAQGYRGINTYELIYAYFGSLFHIDITFFCKFSLCIYIYLITFFVYKIFADEILGYKNSTQFSLLVFCFLLIPSGYAQSHKIAIRMFENWRFQTAIYYGGSIIRDSAIPLYILVFNALHKKINLKRILLFVLLTLSLISFQTSAVTYLLFLLPVFLLFKVLKIASNHFKGSKKINIVLIASALFIILLIESDQIISIVVTDHSKYNNLLQSYLPYYNDIFICDIIALTAFIPIGCKLYFDLKNKNNILYDLIVFFSYLIFRLNSCNFYLSIISIYKFYSMLRILTSVLLMALLYWGVFIIEIFSLLAKNKGKVILSILSISIAVCTMMFIKIDEKKIIKYDAAGQSATPQGFSLKILTANDKMLPDLVANVGNYFNKLPYGNYRIISEGHIPYKNTYIDSESFLLASNRIELAYQSTENEDNTVYGLIQSYLKGKVTYKVAEAPINVSKIQYIISTRSKIVCNLKKHDYKIVYHDKANHSWILKNKNL